MSHASRRHVARVAIGLSITLVFLWLALRRIEMGGVLFALRRVRWYTLPIALTFLAAGYAVRVTRWWWMLRACNPGTRLVACIWPLLVSVAVNNLIPLRIGDALRVVGFRHQLQAPAMRVAATLLIERILDATVLLAFLVAGFTALRVAGRSAVYTRTALIVGAGITLAWAILLLFGDRIEKLLRRACHHRIMVSRGLSEIAESHIHQLFGALTVVRTPSRALGLLLMSTAVWSLEGAVFQTVAYGLSYQGPRYGPWFAFTAATLSTLIPSSPGYVGTFDFFAMSGLIAYGASRSLSAAFAFLSHAILWFPLTAAGLLYVLLPTSRTGREHFDALFKQGKHTA